MNCCDPLTASPLTNDSCLKMEEQWPEQLVFEDHTYLEQIRSVELYRSGWRLSVPARNLRDTASLILEFDDLADETTYYTYTLIHCSAEWEPTDILNTEYLSGLPEHEIRDFRFSRNALQGYKHYRLSFPNDDIQPKIPGNYIIYVYKNYDRNEPVLTRRFYIIEPLVQILPDVHRTDNLKYLSTAQEVDFTVRYQQLRPDDPRRNFKVTLCQNLNWKTAITDLLPRFIQPGELIYNYEEENLFNGGTEFRHFDTKSLKYNSDRVREIVFERPLKHVYLLADLPQSYASYQYQEDLNGRYLVKWDDAFDSDTEADYVNVHFMLNTGEPIPGKDVFVVGELSQWKLENENKCVYNEVSQSYELDMLLKQGYYNYAYAARDQQTLKPDFVEIDGNHFETENDYYIFVYYRDIRERFDRLVGLEIANSVKLPKN